jgi:hypothetical protein
MRGTGSAMFWILTGGLTVLLVIVMIYASNPSKRE